MAQLTYKAMKDNAALKNLPILTLDQRWYRLVPESVKTDEIRYWENVSMNCSKTGAGQRRPDSGKKD